MKTIKDFMPALPGVMRYETENDDHDCATHVFRLRGAEMRLPEGWSITEMQAAVEALKEAKLAMMRDGRFEICFRPNRANRTRGGDYVFKNKLGELAFSDGTAPHECANGPYIIDLEKLKEQPTPIVPGCSGLVAVLPCHNRLGLTFPGRVSLDAYGWIADYVAHDTVTVEANGVRIQGSITQLVPM